MGAASASASLCGDAPSELTGSDRDDLRAPRRRGQRFGQPGLQDVEVVDLIQFVVP